MIKPVISPSHAVKYLNELLRIDPVAITNIFLYRVPSNKLDTHASCQVRPSDNTLSLIGLLNGLLSTDKNPAINMILSPDGTEVLSFELVDNPISLQDYRSNLLNHLV